MSSSKKRSAGNSPRKKGNNWYTERAEKQVRRERRPTHSSRRNPEGRESTRETCRLPDGPDMDRPGDDRIACLRCRWEKSRCRDCVLPAAHAPVRPYPGWETIRPVSSTLVPLSGRRLQYEARAAGWRSPGRAESQREAPDGESSVGAAGAAAVDGPRAEGRSAVEPDPRPHGVRVPVLAPLAAHRFPWPFPQVPGRPDASHTL